MISYRDASVVHGQAIERAINVVRQRELQVEVYEPLLAALDDQRLGVLVAEGRRVLYANRALLAMSGRDSEAVPDAVLDLASAPASRAREPMDEPMELTLTRGDGVHLEVEVSLRRYAARGRERSVTIVRDVTQRKRALAELQQFQRLESIGHLAGGIAHDFNNFLAVILNYAHFVLGELAPSHPVREEVEEIKRTAERGADLTRQLLTFARRDVAKPELLDLNAIVRESERLLRCAIDEGVRLEIVFEAESLFVRADRSQLTQVLMNLALNARDAMPEGGTLRITTSSAPVDVVFARLAGIEPGAYAHITVTDSGTGMTAEVASCAFEPFFSTKREGHGSGLGLSTVYGIAKRSGGHISFTSTPGRGTTIDILLPAVEGPLAAEHEPPGRLFSASCGEAVLLVEAVAT